MQQERAAEEEVNRHLRLEIETLRAPRRIERLATEQLHLVAPARGEAIVIERVAPGRAAGDSRSSRAGETHGTTAPAQSLLGRVRRRATSSARPAPLDWRRRSSRLSCARAARALDRRHRGAAGLPAGVRARRPDGARRAPADADARRRRPSAARSSIATAGCWPTAWTPTPSPPSRPKSTTRPTWPRRSAARSTTAPPRIAQAIAEQLAQQRAVRLRRAPGDAGARRKRVAALELTGIGFIKESRRFYPNSELAAHVLGYVGLDNIGLGGIESAYDSQIRGKDGKVLIQTDAQAARASAASSGRRPPALGVELTIDEYLQHVAERELRAGVEENHAAGGTRDHHGSAHRRDPRAGELADVQPERLRDVRRRRAAQPRRSRTSTSPDRRSRS